MMHWCNLSKQQNIWMMYPPGDKEIYRLYPPQYGNPFYTGRGRGRREWLQERQMDRPNGGFGRGYSQDNGVRAQQTLTDRPQPD